MFRRALTISTVCIFTIVVGPAIFAMGTGSEAPGASARLNPPDPQGCVSGCAGCTAKCAARPEGSLKEITEKLSESYADLRGLSMFFEQKNSWVDMPETGEISRGTLWASGGNRLRMEYSDPKGHLLVSDGKRMWVYVPENKQAVVDSVGVGEYAALGQMILNVLGSGSAKLEGREDVRKVSCHVISVENVTEPPGLASVKIWVDPRVWLARGLQLTDLNDNVTSFTFWNIKRLKEIDESLFTFEAPPGIEVVESPLNADESG